MSAILIIDADGNARRLVRGALAELPFHLSEATSGTAGVIAAADRVPDLVTLELELPDVDGIEALRRLRSFSDVPVIVVTVRDQQSQKVRALDQGADDYMVKPFDPAELRARIQAVLRRNHLPATSGTADLRFGRLHIDLARRLVTSDGTVVQLTRTERRLLELFVTNPGRLLSHDLMLREVWGPAHHDQPNYLRTYVAQLRKKLGDTATEPTLILTEPGVGYRWIAMEAT